MIEYLYRASHYTVNMLYDMEPDRLDKPVLKQTNDELWGSGSRTINFEALNARGLSDSNSVTFERLL
jgi:hypothetical protein